MGWKVPAQQLELKANDMTTQSSRPTHRVSFARIVGAKPDGGDMLGAAHEIGAAWPRRDKPGGILRLNHIPAELTQHHGVLFINLVTDA